MTTMLRSLRVTADYDASSYARGASQKAAADKAMVDSSRLLASALAQADAALNRSNPAEKYASGLARQSRMFQEGYKEAERFQREIRNLNNLMDQGLPLDRAVTQLQNLYRHFDMFADKADLARQGFVSIGNAIDQVNAVAGDAAGIARVTAELDRRTEITSRAARAEHELRAALDPAYDAQVKFNRAIEQANSAFSDHRNVNLYRQQIAALRTEYQALGAKPLAGTAEVDPRRLLGLGPVRPAQQSAAVFEQAAREQERMADAAKLLRMEINPLGAAVDRMNAELMQYQAMADAGVLSTTELAAAQALAGHRFAATQEMLKHVGTGVQLNRHEMANLSYQFNDISVMLASGQSPFMLLMQQGMQIGQIIGPQGLRGGLQALGQGIIAFVTSPVNLAIVGFAALVAGAVKFIQTMKGNLPTIDDLLKKQKDIASQLGESYGGIAKSFLEAWPEDRNVVEIKARLNIKDAQERLRNDLKDVIGGLQPYTITEDELGPLAITRDPNANIFAPYVDAIKKADAQLEKGKLDAQEFRRSLVSIAEANPSLDKGIKELIDLTDQIADAERQTEALQRRLNLLNLTNLHHTRQVIGDIPDTPTLRSFVPDLRTDRQKLDSQYERLVQAAKTSGQVAEATMVYGQAIKSLDDELEKSARLHALDLQAITAKSPAEQAEIAAARVRAEAINTAVDATELDIKAQRAAEAAYRSATAAIDEQNRSRIRAAEESLGAARLESELIGKNNAQTAELRANWQAYIDLRRQAEDNHTAFDEAQFERLKAINSEMATAVRLQNEQQLAYDISTERKLAGMEPGEADIYRRLKGAGLEEGSAAWNRYAEALREANREQHTFFAGLKSGFHEAVANINDFAASGKQIMGDFFGGLEDAWVKWAETGKFSTKDMVRSMLSDLSRLTYRMTMSGILGLLGFGSTAPQVGGSSFGGVFGTALGGIFGSSPAGPLGGGTAASTASGGGLFGGFMARMFPSIAVNRATGTIQQGAAAAGTAATNFAGGAIGIPAAPSQATTSGAYGAGAYAGTALNALSAFPFFPGPFGLAASLAGRRTATGGAAPAGYTETDGYLRSSFFNANASSPFDISLGTSLPTFGEREQGSGGILSSVGSSVTSLFGRGGPGRSSPAIATAATAGLPANDNSRIAGSGSFLDLLGRAEGTDIGRGYNETLGYGRFTGGAQNLTGMTLDEIDALQRSMLAHPDNTFNSSAIGRYQITRRTMTGLRDQMGLGGTELFDPGLQDKMALQLMLNRGPNVAGLRNEWEGLRRVSGTDILSNYSNQIKGLDPTTQQQWQQQIKAAQDSLSLAAGQMAGSAHQFTNDLNSSLKSITNGAQSAGSGFGGALGSALSGIVSAVGGTGGSIISPLLGALFSGFDSGGYTGDAGVSDVAGVVHGKEYVVNASATRRYRPILDLMNYGMHRAPHAAAPASPAANGNETSAGKTIIMKPTFNFTAPGMNQMRRSQNQMASRAEANMRRLARVS